MQQNETHPGNTIVFGGQAGSEGKGAIVGWLALKYDWDAAICSFMTNAGHSWVGDNGEKVVVQQVPMACVNPDIPLLLIGPGSAITVDQLFKEIADYPHLNIADRLKIHPNVMIIEQQDADFEHEHTRYLGSTAKGCGRALARKAMRLRDVKLAKDIPELETFIADTTQIVNDLIDNGGSVLVEGSQGFDLDINHGIEYPYCTSRGTTPAQTLADCGIAPSVINNTIAVIRSFPIRVGNIVEDGKQIGYSGPFGGRELTWDEMTARSRSPAPLEERTTVTKRVRRIFELDAQRLKYMIQVTRPTMLALTFADYIDHDIAGLTQLEYDGSFDGAGEKVSEFLDKLESELGVDIGILKTGPQDDETISFGII